MFQVGDLVRYKDPALANDIPGLVMGLLFKDDYTGSDHIEVQWFDWVLGCIAKERPQVLVVISSVSEGK
jgi:hypothetical protein